MLIQLFATWQNTRNKNTFLLNSYFAFFFSPFFIFQFSLLFCCHIQNLCTWFPFWYVNLLGFMAEFSVTIRSLKEDNYAFFLPGLKFAWFFCKQQSKYTYYTLIKWNLNETFGMWSYYYQVIINAWQYQWILPSPFLCPASIWGWEQDLVTGLFTFVTSPLIGSMWSGQETSQMGLEPARWLDLMMECTGIWTAFHCVLKYFEKQLIATLMSLIKTSRWYFMIYANLGITAVMNLGSNINVASSDEFFSFECILFKF